ncbi:NAD(P)H-quinone oxidoreductase subunit 3 [Stieleria neptunia]|uniref:NADH-quinone oxidoreductase subunit A n=1 Tax=Stieleria neptunia TaxID=2527979 RepID=A0A518HNL3_9BACT|nr:NADH-quinone oxidoreductase subunit A [Stieleria neptunia]QDV42421.1 NAD(P)H-quinone oxidoreductase subunit 3 [Stieleria neptunia]
MDYLFVFLFVVLGIAMVLGGIFASYLLAPRNPTKVKQSPYECGEETIGSSSINFNVAYYLFAILFLVFDVEAAFLFPWAVVLRELGLIGLLEVVMFVLVLIVGLAYAWKKGVLEWES